MFWHRKRKRQRKDLFPEFEGSDRAICMSLNGFYYNEIPVSPQYRMLCIHPYEEDCDPTFSDFALRCAARILEDHPFVLESIVRCDPAYSPDCRWLVHVDHNTQREYILAESSRLLAKLEKPALAELIPEFDRNYFEYEFFAYRKAFTAEDILRQKDDLRKSGFVLRIFCHEIHDYLLVETTEDPMICAEYIQELCVQEGRKLIFNHTRS